MKYLERAFERKFLHMSSFFKVIPIDAQNCFILCNLI